MARAARYGNIQPSVYEAMDYEEGLEMARRVTNLFIEDFKMTAELHVELTKHIMESNGARVF